MNGDELITPQRIFDHVRCLLGHSHDDRAWVSRHLCREHGRVDAAQAVDAVHTETVAFSPGSSLVEVEVAASAKGMTGLRFHVEGPQGSHVVSVGNMTAGGPDCGVGRLSVSENSSCDGFAVGLDVRTPLPNQNSASRSS